MAEVGQRLRTGVYRLSAFRSSQSPPVSSGESPGAHCTFRDEPRKEGLTPDRLEVSEYRAAQRKSERLSRVRKTDSQQENDTLPCATFVDLDSSRFLVFAQTREGVQSYQTALNLSAGLQPLLRDKLLPCRMTPWTVHLDTFRSPQQLRAFCTVVFILAERGLERPGCGLRQRRLKLHPDTPQSSTVCRSYSWRRDSSSKDTPTLYRSRTAYYDILKVSPGATQSQIKTAYYKQSFIYHPDKNPGNKEATQCFAEVSEAYTVLGNINLRKKYDRGILSQSDLQNPGRPSSKEAYSRPTGSPQQKQQHHQQRARRFTQTGGKIMFDFDAFYQAHYGEQLRREKEQRARKEQMEKMQKEAFTQYQKNKEISITAGMLLTTGLLFLVYACL